MRKGKKAAKPPKDDESEGEGEGDEEEENSSGGQTTVLLKYLSLYKKFKTEVYR